MSRTPVYPGYPLVALVAFADTCLLSRVYAVRMRTPVDPKREMVGLGVANLAVGFIRGFPITSSASRTPVAEAAGVRAQLTGVATGSLRGDENRHPGAQAVNEHFIVLVSISFGPLEHFS